MKRLASVVAWLLAPSASLASPPPMDFGDAPYAPCAASLSSDGARHDQLGGGPFLGVSVDTEFDGLPSIGADVDDDDGLDDENGVVFTSQLVQGETASADVTASSALRLDAWVDFDADGNWLDAGEQINFNPPLVAGVNTLAFPVPVTAAVGSTYARFRCSSAGGLASLGLALDREVEDYRIMVPEPASAALGLAALLALLLMQRGRRGARERSGE